MTVMRVCLVWTEEGEGTGPFANTHQIADQYASNSLEKKVDLLLFVHYIAAFEPLAFFYTIPFPLTADHRANS